MKHLMQERPDVFSSFMDLSKSIDKGNSLEEKIKELIKLAACVTQGSSFGVGVHVRKACEYGATKDEIIDTIMYCLPIVGIPLTNQALQSSMATLTIMETERSKNK